MPVVPMHLPHRLSVVTPKGDTGISDDFRVLPRYAIAPALVRFIVSLDTASEYSPLPAPGQSSSSINQLWYARCYMHTKKEPYGSLVLLARKRRYHARESIMPSRVELCPYDLLPPCCCFLALLSKYSSTHVTIIMIRPKALITFIAASYGLRINGYREQP